MPIPTDNSWASSADGQALVDAFLALDSDETVVRFLRDLCTKRELEEMVSRWAVVRRLDEGTSYRAISSDTGVSTATITRINDWLRNGTGGYVEAIDRAANPGRPT